MPDLCSKKHRWILVLHDTAEGVACQTLRSELCLHGVSGCRIDSKSKNKGLLTLLDIRNAISLCLRFYCMKTEFHFYM